MRLPYRWLYNGLAVTAVLGCSDVTEPDAEPIPEPPRWVQVAAGASHTCGLVSDGATYCWGRNRFGRLGTGGADSSFTPVKVTAPIAFESLSASQYHTCGLTDDGRAYCWGHNTHGSLGDGTNEHRSIPTAVAGNHRFKHLSVGYLYTCAIDQMGTPYCWGAGDDDWAHLGSEAPALCPEPFPSCFLTPTPVETGKKFLEITAGMMHTCGVDATGQASCWGAFRFGALGRADQPPGALGGSSTPLPVETDTRFTHVRAGSIFTCGLEVDGWGWCWGTAYDRDGESRHLGLGSGLSSTWSVPPTKVASEERFGTIVPSRGNSAYVHTCGITDGGALLCWGDNEFGQLGNPNVSACRVRDVHGRVASWNPCSSSPVSSQAPLRFKSVELGTWHTCGIDEADRLLCWGRNHGGQLGAAPSDWEATPVEVLLPPL